MSRFLVTGGAGFIGSHLVDQLVSEGKSVVVLDDLSTGSLKNIPYRKEVELIEGSLLDLSLLEKIFPRIAGCFHLAAVASVQKSILDWSKSHHVNLTGTLNVFLQACLHNVPVVYTSSAAVYGAAQTFPLQETETPKPLSPYAVDKLSCELQARIFGSLKNLKSCGLRPFNVYGRRQLKNSDYSGVISIFKQLGEEQKDLTIFGDGYQTRDFIHVMDVARAFVQALPAASTAAPVVNVCTGGGCTINTLAQMISKMTKAKGLRYLPAQPGSVETSVGDPRLAETMLNFKAQIDLEEGLLDFCKSSV